MQIPQQICISDSPWSSNDFLFPALNISGKYLSVSHLYIWQGHRRTRLQLETAYAFYVLPLVLASYPLTKYKTLRNNNTGIVPQRILHKPLDSLPSGFERQKRFRVAYQRTASALYRAFSASLWVWPHGRTYHRPSWEWTRNEFSRPNVAPLLSSKVAFFWYRRNHLVRYPHFYFVLVEFSFVFPH